MRFVPLTGVAALALAAAACNSNESASNISTEENLAADAAANDVLGANAAADAAATPTDVNGFATAAAAADLYEIESARLAAAKATNAELKSAAQHIRTDHEKSTAELKTAASEAQLTLNPALDAEGQAMLDQLKAASGAEFDQLFLDQQKTAHQKALALHQGYASGGDNDRLKAFAAKTANAVKGHLDHLNGIKL